VALVSRYDWLLLFHLIGAFAMVTALVLFTVVAVAARRVDRATTSALFLRAAAPGGPLIGAGGFVALVFGIWLAIDLDSYQLWDGWILAAIALWVVGVAAGTQSGKVYAQAREVAERLVAERRGDDPSRELSAALHTRKGLVLHIVTSVAVLAILALMIFKPGA
jgi:uncharacterized membrane protein